MWLMHWAEDGHSHWSQGLSSSDIHPTRAAQIWWQVATSEDGEDGDSRAEEAGAGSRETMSATIGTARGTILYGCTCLTMSRVYYILYRTHLISGKWETNTAKQCQA